jgi:hypothetical protein
MKIISFAIWISSTTFVFLFLFLQIFIKVIRWNRGRLFFPIKKVFLQTIITEIVLICMPIVCYYIVKIVFSFTDNFLLNSGVIVITPSLIIIAIVHFFWGDFFRKFYVPENFFVCPNCNFKITLDKKELGEGFIICPNCKNDGFLEGFDINSLRKDFTQQELETLASINFNNFTILAGKYKACDPEYYNTNILNVFQKYYDLNEEAKQKKELKYKKLHNLLNKILTEYKKLKSEIENLGENYKDPFALYAYCQIKMQLIIVFFNAFVVSLFSALLFFFL